MSRDYIPGADAEFDTWVATFSAYLSANAGALGITAGDAAAIVAAVSSFGSAYGNALQLQSAASAASEAKSTQRSALEALIRPVVKAIQARAQTTDAQRAALGVRIPNRARSRAAAPSSRPIVIVDASHRLQHTLVIRDEQSLTSRSRPVGVSGAEIYCFVNGTPPTDPSQCKLVAVAKRSSVKVTFTGADAGKNAFYMVRWTNNHDEAGPWSETAAATIAA